MTILVFGKDGQLGRALQNILQAESQLHLANTKVLFLGRADCDLSDTHKLEEIIESHQPSSIINASAYTAVDKAESEPDLAFAINAKAPELMAKHIAKQQEGLFVHFSTDYVFADTQSEPYYEDSPSGPANRLSVYGQSKLAGEQIIKEVFDRAANQSAHYILRASWVYGDGGNFIKTIMRLAQEKDSLNIVADQIGVPTAATFLAKVAQVLLLNHIQTPARNRPGIYHVVPDGSTSWHSLAVYVINQMNRLGIKTKVDIARINPIPAKDYPLPASRPYNSRLNNEKLKRFINEYSQEIKFKDWQQEVSLYIQDLHLETKVKQK